MLSADSGGPRQYLQWNSMERVVNSTYNDDHYWPNQYYRYPPSHFQMHVHTYAIVESYSSPQSCAFASKNWTGLFVASLRRICVLMLLLRVLM